MLPLKGVVRFLKHEERALSRKRLVGDFQICLRCIGWGEGGPGVPCFFEPEIATKPTCARFLLDLEQALWMTVIRLVFNSNECGF